MNTFKRYEKKYILTCEQKRALEIKIQDYMELDPYCKVNKNYLIRNIYYDTEQNQLIHMSVNKPIFKEKLRVRKYGTYNDGVDQYFLEIKRKYQSIVYKRRVKLTKEELENFLSSGLKPQKNVFLDNQVNNELSYLIKTYTVVPKVFISYIRIAYFDRNDSSFRLTFDNEIHSRRHNIDFDDSSYEHELIPKDMYLMEVKTGTSFPLWFASILSELKIYPSSFSKYGKDYKLYKEEQ